MISFKDVNFTYDQQKSMALKVENLHIKAGEFVVLTGASGSGKSTLTKIINGLIPNFFEGNLEGEVFLDEKDARKLDVCGISQIVSSVFQDPASQFFTEEVNSELAFTCENFGVERTEIIKRMARSATLVEIEDLLGQKLQSLSGGQKQKVAIATALTMPVKILLLDEPSSNLDYAAINKLTKLLEKLKSEGFTILVAEHRLYYLKSLLDRVLYMRSAQIEQVFDKNEFLNLSNDDLHKMGLRSLDLFSNEFENSNLQIGEPIVNFKNLTYSFPKAKKAILSDINLQFKAGEIIALVGKNGAGKTTLARLLTGIYTNKSNKFEFNGREIKANDLHKNINFVMQDVSYQMFGDSAFNELLLTNQDIESIEAKIEAVLKELGLWEFRNLHPFSLSMGQRQRLVLATTYIKQTPLTIMDEPTSGLDFLSMQRVADLIKQIAQQGKGVLIITHDYELIAQTCNRVLLLEEGTISEDFILQKEELGQEREQQQKLEQIFLNRLD